ncbi:unnamed protein product [Candidula unifasciata]|uniref:Uncharacterized protein n=1 Tax=Candidula unifasciata TaxID=100452 RepID=A0A8S3ZN66_9EUPU|nr:unnamed protein product [Candidula unifasciata]
MALTGRSTEPVHAELVQDLVRLPQDGRSLVQSGTRVVNAVDHSTGDRANQGLPAIIGEMAAQKGSNKEAHTAFQNAEAIVVYNKKEKKAKEKKGNVREEKKPKVREGKQAAAVDQIHQNDLHNIEQVSDVQQSKESMVMPSGMVLDLPDKAKNGSRGQEVNGSKTAKGLSQNSELVTSFDPMKDRHQWAMWRTAVNGRIIDEVRRLEKMKIEIGPAGVDPTIPGLYGTALVMPPLKQFIRFDSDDDEAIAKQMLGHGPLSLGSFQFVYFGLPRVQLAKITK